jgi:hypothetical protein
MCSVNGICLCNGKYKYSNLYYRTLAGALPGRIITNTVISKGTALHRRAHIQCNQKYDASLGGRQCGSAFFSTVNQIQANDQKQEGFPNNW